MDALLLSLSGFLISFFFVMNKVLNLKKTGCDVSLLQDLSKVLKTSHYHCPDLDPQFDPYEGLEGEVPIPKDAFEEFADTIQPVEDRVSEKLSAARLHASEAFRLVKGTLSVTMNQASQSHLHACQVEIQVSIKALIEASLRLSDAVVAQASD